MDIFKIERIGNLEEKIGDEDKKEKTGEGEGKGEDAYGEKEGIGEGEGDGKITLGDRTIFFDGMETIAGGIKDIIEGISGAGSQIKNPKAAEYPEEEGLIKQFAGKDKGSKDTEIFNPVDRPGNLDEIYDCLGR